MIYENLKLIVYYFLQNYVLFFINGSFYFIFKKNSIFYDLKIYISSAIKKKPKNADNFQ